MHMLLHGGIFPDGERYVGLCLVIRTPPSVGYINWHVPDLGMCSTLANYLQALSSSFSWKTVWAGVQFT